FPPVKSADQMNDEEDDEIPRDPPPFLPPTMDVHRLEKCKHCNEMWPVAQMMMHLKYEHPLTFVELARWKCRKCKQVGFHSCLLYADHFEECMVNDKFGPIHASHPQVAPRSVNIPSRSAVCRTAVPEFAWSQIIPCRLCSSMLPTKEMMKHMKEEHPLRHFTDAPYPCLQCGEVAFYRHADYAKHAMVCKGNCPTADLAKDLFAIVLNESLMTENDRADFVAYRSCFSVVRNKGSQTFLDMVQQCVKCHTQNPVLASFALMARHVSSCPSAFYPRRSVQCKGCGAEFASLPWLMDHARVQNRRGNVQCFNMGRIFQNPVNTFGKINVIALRDSIKDDEADGDSLLVAYWMKELELQKKSMRPKPENNLLPALPYVRPVQTAVPRLTLPAKTVAPPVLVTPPIRPIAPRPPPPTKRMAPPVLTLVTHTPPSTNTAAPPKLLSIRKITPRPWLPTSIVWWWPSGSTASPQPCGGRI
ncbi:hypothetical protein PMAYCL1PPCAC_01579, partial [Pristionchus mayeri]